jgi:hypothetical protein
MRHRRSRLALAVWVLGLASVRVIQAQVAATELTPEQRRTVDSGGQVFVAEDVAGASWPRACTYQFVAASPDEAAAVFTDYARHAAFIPDIKKSAVSRVIDQRTAEVDYVLDMPIVADEAYTVRDQVSAAPDGTQYRVDWTLVRASSTKATVGGVRFERYSTAAPAREGTLMAYCNFVTPGSRLARLGFIKTRAMDQLRATTKAIAREVERQRAEMPAAVAARARALKGIVAP